MYHIIIDNNFFFYIILLVINLSRKSHELEDYTNIREKRVFSTEIARVLKIPATTPSTLTICPRSNTDNDVYVTRVHVKRIGCIFEIDKGKNAFTEANVSLL